MRRARLLAGLLATTTIGLGAVEIDANLAARAELQRLLDRDHGLSVASIFAEPLTGRVTLYGVRVGRGDTRITVGTLALPLPRGQMFGWHGLALVTPAAASPFGDKPDDSTPGEKSDEPTPGDSKPDTTKPDEPPAPAPTAETPSGGTGDTATAENVVITKGVTTYHIKSIVLTGTSLSNADLASLIDTNSAEPVEARLKKLTADSISVPEIDIDESDAAAFHGSVTQILLTGVKAGKIKTGSVGAFSFTSKDSSSGDMSGSVGGIQASGLDLTQIAHVVNDVRTDESEAIMPLYDSITVTALKVANATKKGSFTLSALKETGAKARPLKTGIAATSQAGTGKLSDAQQMAAYDDVIHSFDIGSIEMTGLNVDGGDGNALSLESVSMQDFAQSKIGGFAMRALSFQGPKVKFGVATVDIGPIVLPPARLGAAPSSNAMVPSAAKADITQIDVDVDKDAGGPPARVQFKVAHIGFESDGDVGDIPRTSQMKIENITFDLPPGVEQAQPLVDMGYSHFDLSLGVASNYDGANQILKIQDITLNGANMASLAVGLTLANVTKGLVSSNPDIVKASAVAILAKGVTAYLANDGFIDKLLAYKAKQDGLSVDKEKATLVDLLDTKIPPPLNQSANVKIVASALVKFINDPKNLYISVESKSGLGVGSMALLNDPTLLIDSLDVKAIANQ